MRDRSRWDSPLLVLLGLLCVCLVPVSAAEPWATYRGNMERTGNTDGKPGPAAPKVLWVLKSQDHFVAAPVPFGDRVHVSSLGAFNVSTVQALAAEPRTSPRTVWAKTTPLLKLPTVSSPAVAEGNLLFGDGMHQTDGAILHCLRLDSGQPLWQLPVPGTLVHLEGSPAVEKGKVYIGGGAAGVLCVDMNRVTLDGKEMDLKETRKVLDSKWAELVKKYEEEKKKDPDFAVPPNEEQLPKPAPVVLWQQGAGKWHVDGPVAVAGEQVLVASALLEDEKVGERALYSLDARTGQVKWRAALTANPWGGPSVRGDTVVVGGSTIRYDPKAIAGARGEVAACTLAGGKPKWRKDIKGGVIASVALGDGVAVAAATDGKVYAFALETGELRWNFDAKAPFFAAPALAGGVVYAADLRGVVHAIGLADGARKWALDLGSDPAVAAPGMVYGGPVLHGGRIFVATCNLEGPHMRKGTVVVCIGEK